MCNRKILKMIINRIDTAIIIYHFLRKITANDKIYAASEIENLIRKFIKTNASILEILTKKSTTAVNIEFDFHQTAEQKKRKTRNALTQIVSTVHLSNKLTLSTVRRKAKIHVSTIPRDR